MGYFSLLRSASSPLDKPCPNVISMKKNTRSLLIHDDITLSASACFQAVYFHLNMAREKALG